MKKQELVESSDLHLRWAEARRVARCQQRKAGTLLETTTGEIVQLPPCYVVYSTKVVAQFFFSGVLVGFMFAMPLYLPSLLTELFKLL